MEFPKELYQPKTLLTLGGASIAVVVVGGVSGQVFGFNPRWLGLLVAEVLAFVGLSQMKAEFRKRRLVGCVVALINGALIYSQAVGLNALNNAVPSSGAKTGALLSVDAGVWWTSADQQAAAEAMAASATDAWDLAQAATARAERLATQVETLRQTADDSVKKLEECQGYLGTLLEAAAKPQAAPPHQLALWKQQGATLQQATSRIDADLKQVPKVDPRATQQLQAEYQRTETRLRQTKQTLQQAYALGKR